MNEMPNEIKGFMHSPYGKSAVLCGMVREGVWAWDSLGMKMVKVGHVLNVTYGFLNLRQRFLCFLQIICHMQARVNLDGAAGEG